METETLCGLVPIAALFVTKGGVYYDLEAVDPWDEERDARLYDGPWPVVAHPPCARWSRLAGFTEARFGLKRGDDGGCFESALRSVRTFGGVLEHPAHSAAWARFGLPKPITVDGWTLGIDGGASCYVEQGRYGLPVKKATWLYAYGVELADLRWGFTADANGDPENQNEHGGLDAWRDKFKGRRESWIAGAPNRGTVERDGDRRNRTFTPGTDGHHPASVPRLADRNGSLGVCHKRGRGVTGVGDRFPLGLRP